MVVRRWFLPFLLSLTIGVAAPLRAQGPLTLAGPSGAKITFTETESSWAWTGLITPHTGESGLPVAEEGLAKFGPR